MLATAAAAADLLLLLLLLLPSAAHIPPSSQASDTAIGLGIDVIRMDKIALTVVSLNALVSSSERCEIRNLPRGVLPHPKTRAATAWVFAQRGKDLVHPSPEGHLLIGRVVAQYVSDRLGMSSLGVPGAEATSSPFSTSSPPSTTSSTSSTSSTASSAFTTASASSTASSLGSSASLSRAKASLPPGPLQRLSALFPSATSSAAEEDLRIGAGWDSGRTSNDHGPLDEEVWEACYSAQTLPVLNGTPPWEVIDEGGAKVRKPTAR